MVAQMSTLWKRPEAKRERNEEIVRALLRGERASIVAHQHHLSKNRVYQILDRWRKAREGAGDGRG
jgi:hypothetical protein